MPTPTSPRRASRGAPRSVCIVTPAHVASNPRVLKEADALHQAGLDVRVVFAEHESSAYRQYDREILANREWRWSSVQLPSRHGSRVRWALGAATERVLQGAPTALWRHTRVAERAESRAFASLARLAAEWHADLFIGHYAEGLAAAASAAAVHNSRLAFDAEDFHTGEANPAAQLARVDFIQRRYLPRCSYVSAASDGIGKALADRYGLSEPITIHNTFPWADRAGLTTKKQQARDGVLSLYWYSQVIGLDRGIQDAIRALALLNGPAALHLRGVVSDQARSGLTALAREQGVLDRVFFHPIVSPDELLATAIDHDVGLALEQGTVFNRAICVTNKLFFFMLAGLAIAATDVPGQSAILSRHPEAACLYRAGDVGGLAGILERFRTSPELVQRAKAASLDAARNRWNWEIESQRLVSQVEKTLSGRDQAPAISGSDAWSSTSAQHRTA